MAPPTTFRIDFPPTVTFPAVAPDVFLSTNFSQTSADTSVRKCPNDFFENVTDLKFNFGGANSFIPALFKTDGLVLSFLKGKEMTFRIDHFQFHLPSFPAPEKPAITISGILSGDFTVNFDSSTGLPILVEAHVTIDPLDLTTLGSQEIPWKDQCVPFNTSLQGRLKLDYVPSDPTEPIRAEWNLVGSASGEFGKQSIQLKNLRFEGEGLDNLHASLSGDLAGIKEGKENFFAKGLRIFFEEKKFTTFPEASLELGARQVQVGDFSFTPSANLKFTVDSIDDNFPPLSSLGPPLPRRERVGERVTIEGQWNINSDSPKVSIGSNLYFSTDLEKYEWAVHFLKDQIFGLLKAHGQMEIQAHGEHRRTRKGEFPFQEVPSLLEGLQVVTQEPYQIDWKGQPVLRGLEIFSGGASYPNRVSLRVASILDEAEGEANLRWFAGSHPLRGDYRVRVRPQRVGPQFLLKDILVRGRFIPFSQKSQLFISGSAKAQLGGELKGPVQADYRGLVHWKQLLFKKWGSSFSFSPRQKSTVTVGPIAFRKGQTIEGKGNLQGTIDVTVEDNNGIRFGGRKIGIKEGQVWVGSGRSPVITNFSVVCDRWKGIHRGVIFCGGEGIRADRVEVDAGAGVKGRTSWVVDRLPITESGSWWIFKNWLKKFFSPS
jgi:hypothetical protein